MFPFVFFFLPLVLLPTAVLFYFTLSLLVWSEVAAAIVLPLVSVDTVLVIAVFTYILQLVFADCRRQMFVAHTCPGAVVMA